ncbi:hypothetical protein MED121_10125 [Marinomonas sp. MED121]|uniref:gamma-glutamylcyclotransferase family protein n=1 Tax=Marinomonas sp. MED121 TaxID=314277 RepID=UPI000068FB33|nr:gamma-glutamylcyclotransferase family protein [Marinomonas sp. MED121]EAQ65069.1 hypothetical protein MED121_10125 [Marinomonas sp. MED121]
MTDKNRHFIFGYGSLINATSRAKTGETGQVWPVKIAGYQRNWSVMSTEFGMSSVAVIPLKGAYCNGVLIEINESEIPSFDERERGYERSQIQSEQLSAYQGQALPKGTIWIYHSHEIAQPTQECPIALSYVDVILSGCLELGESFVQDFLSLTQGWHSPLINDRQTPRYPRVQPELNTQVLIPLLEPVTNISKQELSISYES